MRKICFLAFLLFSGCQTVELDKPSSSEQLESSLGLLSIAYMETYTYKNGYRGVHGAKVTGVFHDIYQSQIKYLDEPYRVKYFLTSLWIIPFQSGEINYFIETVANDSCSKKFLEELNNYIEDEKDHIYQADKYELAVAVKNGLESQLALN